MKVFHFEVRVAVGDGVDEVEVMNVLKQLAETLSGTNEHNRRTEAKVSLVFGSEGWPETNLDAQAWTERAQSAITKQHDGDTFQDETGSTASQ